MEGNLEHVSTLDQLFLINWKLFLLRKFLLTGDVSNYSQLLPCEDDPKPEIHETVMQLHLHNPNNKTKSREVLERSCVLR